MVSEREEFLQALSASDEAFGAYIQKSGNRIISGLKPALVEKKKDLPPEQAALIDQILPYYGLFLRREAPTSDKESQSAPSPSNMGIKASFARNARGEPIDKFDSFELTLSSGYCVSCQAPEHLPSMFTCDDLGDPAQVRGSQLMRMMTSLHELGHALDTYKGIKDDVTNGNLNFLEKFFTPGAHKEGDIIFSGASVRSLEMRADVFAGAVILSQLGDEGAAFLRQWAAGLRGRFNGSGADHDTSIALAGLLAHYQRDPAFFAELKLDTANGHAKDMTEGLIASEEQRQQVERRFKAGFTESSSIVEVKDKSAARLESFAYLEKLQKDMTDRLGGQAIVLPGMDIYAQYYKPADALMMSPQELTDNLNAMVDLGPLKNSSLWREQSQQAVQQCKVAQKNRSPKAE